MIDEKLKSDIININKRLNIKTEFIDLGDILGYSVNDTIYINDKIKQDYKKTNAHELLHFYEDTEIFKKLKENILNNNKEKVGKLREEYKLRYLGLYSSEEIDNGIIDTEIVIDMIIDSFEIEYKNGITVGNYILGTINNELKNKRYLTLTIKNNINQMNLSKWEKLFIVNYYDGRTNKFPNKDKYEIIREDIEKELNRLYELSNDENNFKINVNSIEILREYESEIKALKQRGEDTTYIERNKKVVLEELSKKFSKQLYEEYKHIVDYIKSTNYEDAFKALMLRETLSKTYKLDNKKAIIKKRDINNSISSHMIINEDILRVIYENIDEYTNFADIYFIALEIYNKKIAESSTIDIDSVETYKMGKWIKFEGKKSNESEYIENSKKLASLVKDTPWCTKTLTSSQLTQGDFYVFVDNENKPHIAVKLNGNEIDEVRGIENGNAQEIEEEYRKVAISFLENNQDIKYGKEWLEKEEWNKRLIEYINKIDNNQITVDDIPNIMKDILYNDYKNHSGYENTNKKEIMDKLPSMKDKIAIYYNCKEDEIYFGNINFDVSRKSLCDSLSRGSTYIETINVDICPYVVIIGDVMFESSTKIGKLKYVSGHGYFTNYKYQDIGELEYIGKDAMFLGAKITSLENLKFIGGEADFRHSKIIDISNIEYIGGKIRASKELEEQYKQIVEQRNQNKQRIGR